MLLAETNLGTFKNVLTWFPFPFPMQLEVSDGFVAVISGGETSAVCDEEKRQNTGLEKQTIKQKWKHITVFVLAAHINTLVGKTTVNEVVSAKQQQSKEETVAWDWNLVPRVWKISPISAVRSSCGVMDFRTVQLIVLVQPETLLVCSTLRPHDMVHASTYNMWTWMLLVSECPLCPLLHLWVRHLKNPNTMQAQVQSSVAAKDMNIRIHHRIYNDILFIVRHHFIQTRTQLKILNFSCFFPPLYNK